MTKEQLNNKCNIKIAIRNLYCAISSGRVDIDEARKSTLTDKQFLFLNKESKVYISRAFLILEKRLITRNKLSFKLTSAES